jgi:hypothetical protein
VALALLEIVPADPAAAPAFDAMVLVAQRIRTRIRTSDTIGRVAPSVLAVVVEMPPDAPPAFMIGGRLVEAAKDVLLWCADEFRLRASVVSADDLVSPGAEELFRVAVEQLGPPA